MPRKPLTNKNNKTTTEEFIKKAIEKHGDKYNYDKVKYVASRVKVIITCPIHGDFEQVPESHLKPMGCFKCGRNLPQKRKPKKEDYIFIEEAKLVHGDKYDYSLVEYLGNRVPVKILCKHHGEFEQKPFNHLRTDGCQMCSKDKKYGDVEEKTAKFIEKAVAIHGDRYDYSLSKVVNSVDGITITCNIHGNFTQSKSNHLSGQGCYICGRVVQGTNGRAYTTDTFIQELSKIHPILDFKDTIYNGMMRKVTYVCTKHGKQSSFAGNLLRGHSCKECYNDRRKNEPGSWSYSSWEEKALISNYFDSFKVYIIRCWNEEEEFYKIGRTFVTIETRFRGKRAMPYKYEVIKIIEAAESKVICQKENELKVKNKQFKYKPKIDFGGMYECFNKVIYD